MPIQPIGKLKRKGSLGSCYSVQNFTEVNPEFGTKDDFKELVEIAHKNGMLVLLDWVANHSSWDNVWIYKHPEWYMQDKSGKIISPVPEWSDVAKLNYDNNQMRQEMINSMKYWIENFDIDGFRCDMAMLVPTDFWNDARIQLDKIKPVFMLAEAEDETDLFKTAFDMSYTWRLLHLTEDIAKGRRKAVDLIDYFLEEPKKFLPKTLRMPFTSNHDENSWNGSVYERYPNCHKTFAVFSFLIPGMPLIYNGQEVSMNKALNFFDKDQIDWKKSEMRDLYQFLIKLKKDNEALWNGEFGAKFEFAPTENNEQIFTFIREKNDNKILALFNFSDKETWVKYSSLKAYDTYYDAFTKQDITIDAFTKKHLEPWEYKIFVKK